MSAAVLVGEMFGMSTKGEIINLHVGQAGCQLGSACWEIYCLEHKIRADGIHCDNTESVPSSFFSSTKAEKNVPRASFIDLEPTVIDEIRTGRYRGLFNPNLLISGKEDASNCFPRGYFTLGKEIMQLILERLRSLVEECDNLQGFLVSRAYGGGTGSGLVAYLMENLSDHYPKSTKFEFSIYPAPKLSSVIVEPYNAALATHQSLEHANGCFIVDNEACYDICERLLDICSPSYFNINRLMSHVVSNVTAALRFENSVDVSLKEIQMNLIPYPRIQYPIISYAPLVSEKQVVYENLTESSLLNSCFEPANQMVKCDVRKGKYMACSVFFRGDVSAAAINSSISSIKAKRSVNFVEWCPTGFKISVNRVPPNRVPGGDLALVDKCCMMLANSTAVKTAWTKINRKFDLMFAKKAFIHWYISEGLEEGDFHDTRLDLGTLELDYVEAESEC